MSESVGGDESAPEHSDANRGSRFFHHVCLLRQIYGAGAEDIKTRTHAHTHTTTHKELGFLCGCFAPSHRIRGGAGRQLTCRRKRRDSGDTVSRPPFPRSLNSHLSLQQKKNNHITEKKKVEVGSVQTVPGGDAGPGIPPEVMDYGGLLAVQGGRLC